MGLMNGSLQIGRSAINASQGALAVTGNNIANSATPSYSRQQVHLAPTQYTEVAPGKYTGTGVALYDVRRQVDTALNGRIGNAMGETASYETQQQALARVEATFNELTEEDLSTRLNAFFSSFSSLQNQPHDTASRSVAIQEGESLAYYVKSMRAELYTIQKDLDSQVRFQVKQADTLAGQIAELNEQVVLAEAGRAGSAAALRDQRDDLVKQLNEIINITTREVEGGSLNVFVGNEPLIQFTDNRGLDYKEQTDANGNILAQIIFADNQEAAELSTGKIHGQIKARDEQLGGVISDLDEWSKALIYEVNRLHSLGRGLETFTSLQSELTVADTAVSLGDSSLTELPWDVDNGVFFVHVYDSNGSEISQEQIKVDIGHGSDTTLTGLANQLDAIDGITATIDSASKLNIAASNSGQTIAFSSPDNQEMATNVMAVLGFNTFFDGYNAHNINVDPALLDSPRRLAVSANGLPGNGDVAAQIAQLGDNGVDSLNGLSIIEAFSDMIGDIATNSKTAQDNFTASQVSLETLEMERQMISGVSVDEEAINMITFQRAFQGAARYVTLIDEMMDDVMSII